MGKVDEGSFVRGVESKTAKIHWSCEDESIEESRMCSIFCFSEDEIVWEVMKQQGKCKENRLKD